MTSTLFVTSLAEVWIEMRDEASHQNYRRVTSLAEVWIEIPTACQIR